MSDKDKVIEAFKNSEEPLNAKKVSELSGVEKKEVDKIMKELKKDETIVSPKFINYFFILLFYYYYSITMILLLFIILFYF